MLKKQPRKGENVRMKPRPGIQPDTYVPPPPPVHPNIRSIEPHSACWRLDWKDPLGTRVGDVRRCHHGHIQLRTQTSPRSRLQGPGMDYWQTLSPIWNPVLYRRARKALG